MAEGVDVAHIVEDAVRLGQVAFALEESDAGELRDGVFHLAVAPTAGKVLDAVEVDMRRVGHVEHVVAVGEVVAGAQTSVVIGGEGVGDESERLGGAVDGIVDVVVSVEESLLVEGVDAGTQGRVGVGEGVA